MTTGESVELKWDPEIDTPATIAVIGGGPAAVEAALYGRFLGYDVLVFTRTRIGPSLARWGEAAMPVPFGQVATSLGLAALEAQGKPCQISPDEIISFRRYADEYLVPVAKTDLLYENINIQSQVQSISRTGAWPYVREDLDSRSHREFRLLIESQRRGQYAEIVDLVLDCTGRAGRLGMASGGGRSAGEPVQGNSDSKMLVGKRDVLGAEAERFAGRSVFMWGDSLAACAMADEFYRLAEKHPGTKLTWALPTPALRLGLPGVFESRMAGDVGGYRPIIRRANTLVEMGELPIVVMGCEGVERCQEPVEHEPPEQSGSWAIRLQISGDNTLDIEADEVINAAAPRSDWTISDAIDPKPITGAPASVTAEPHYYVIGSKCLGGVQAARPAHVPLSSIPEQIRQAYSLIVGRSDLDLYATVKPQQ